MASIRGCEHLAAIETVRAPQHHQCDECVKVGARASGHPVIASAEPGERWLYGYADDAFVEY
jgi:hypothetical protein